ncbi:MAG TPA: hypothetical protein VGL34_06960 [Steroidobacteraceae bacterium]|jgi:hypothetical protein
MNTDEGPPRADVYAGDTTNLVQSAGQPEMVYLYAIEADAEPDVLARVANLFNLANVAPLSAELRRKPTDQVGISVAIGPMSFVIAGMIHRKLAQLTCVNNVELTTDTPVPGTG